MNTDEILINVLKKMNIYSILFESSDMLSLMLKLSKFGFNIISGSVQDRYFILFIDNVRQYYKGIYRCDFRLVNGTPTYNHTRKILKCYNISLDDDTIIPFFHKIIKSNSINYLPLKLEYD
jgi:hypothetical protein